LTVPLVIIAHPDDETIWCGATVAALGAAGRTVGILCLTNGANPTRRDEFERACKVLGARASIRSLADDKRVALSVDDDVFASWLKGVRPALVLGHGAEGELHGHRHHSQCAALAWRWARARGVPYLAFAPGVPSGPVPGGILRRCCVAPCSSAKQTALAVYASQSAVIMSLAEACGPVEAFSGSASAFSRLSALAPHMVLLDEEMHG